MYKVFIDNKVVIFTKNWKINSKNADYVEVRTDRYADLDLVNCRNRLPYDVTLIVRTGTPEETIREVFADFEFVQAAGGLVRRKQQYLFIERHGVWDIPKGKMEGNESPEETAVREVEEECGITGPVISKLIGITYHTYEFNGRPVLKKNWWYAMEYDGPKALVPQAEEAITQAVWLSRREWKNVRSTTYASIAEVLDMLESGK